MRTFFVFILTTIFSFQIIAQSFDAKKIEKSLNKTISWQVDNRFRRADYDWTYAAFYTGVFAAYDVTKNDTIYNELVKMGRKIYWRPGIRLTHADDQAIIQVFADMYNSKYTEAEDTIENSKEYYRLRPSHIMLEDFMAHPYRTDDTLRLTTWWWCDALYMAPASMIKMGLILKDDKYLQYSDSLYKETYKLLWDTEEKLFARDVRYIWEGKDDSTILKEKNGEKIFWSRGNGWVFAGLANVLLSLPQDYPERPFYENLFQEMAERIAGLQQEDGFWRASLLDPESYPGGETSGTGFYCYGFAWGVNNGLLDKDKYLPVVEKSWHALETVVQKNGKVGWVQPIGADPRANFNKDSWQVYGTGAYLLAGSEILKMIRTEEK